MTPQEYCYQQAITPGSDWYYSLMKMDPQVREAIITIAAFYRELEKIVFDVEDVNIAQTKFHWWREQVVRDQPDHPVAIMLKRARLPQKKLQALIDGMEQRLFPTTYARFEEVVIDIMRTAGMREILISEVVEKNIPQEIIYQLTLCVELIHYMQRLRFYVRHGLIYFSEDELKKFSVSISDLQKFKTTESVRALLSFQADKAVRAYEGVIATMSSFQQNQLKNLIRRCRIALADLQVMREGKFAVLENFMSVTALRRFWIVWRGK